MENIKAGFGEAIKAWNHEFEQSSQTLVEGKVYQTDLSEISLTLYLLFYI